jgi:hypothetical protein
MRYFLFFILFIGSIVQVRAQDNYLFNPSFESPTGSNSTPWGWTSCNGASTPDTQPDAWGPGQTGLAPTNGMSYLGLTLRGNEGVPSGMPSKNEDVQTKLIHPFLAGRTYKLSIDLAAPAFTDGIINYTNFPKLRISGGKQDCVVNEVLGLSGIINNRGWKRYTFMLTPNDSILYLKLEVYLETFKAAYLVLDNIEIDECFAPTIKGNTSLCQGQNNVTYSFFKSRNVKSYAWSYSGQGCTINSDTVTNSITVDYGKTATSGTLSLYVNRTGCPTLIDTSNLSINVNPLPLAADTIMGNPNACFDQNSLFTIKPIQNATTYVWNYSGTGPSLSANKDSAVLSFTASSTNGVLSVYGVNRCGVGSPSPGFPITVSSCDPNYCLPPIIVGDTNVCLGQKGIFYKIPYSHNITSYTWEYTGTGFTISSGKGTEYIIADYGDDAVNGKITLRINKTGCTTVGTSMLPITINHVPPGAGAITGDSKTCFNQNSLFYIAPIQNAGSYVWNYSGTGANLFAHRDSVFVYFADNATDGVLSVYGVNQCGMGSPSPDFTVQVGLCNQGLPANFSIPNSFSPNGDGLNEFFYIEGLVKNSELIIFNRLGQKLYETNNYQNDWDGKDDRGNKLETGTYWYVLKCPGIPTEFKGYVYLKR